MRQSGSTISRHGADRNRHFQSHAKICGRSGFPSRNPYPENWDGSSHDPQATLIAHAGQAMDARSSIEKGMFGRDDPGVRKGRL